MGKGSSPRPFNVSNQEYSSRWDAIFGRDNEKKNEAQANLVNEHKYNHSCNRGRIDNPQGEAGQTTNDGVLGT